MDKFLELLFASGLGLSAFTDDLWELDRSMPKSDFFALLVLERRGQATMSELAADLGAPLSTVTGISSRLAKKGLVLRERDTDDRRAIITRLTPEGKALARKLQQQLSGLFARAQAALTPEEIGLLFQLVQKVLVAMSEPLAKQDNGVAVAKPHKIIILD